ncbi:MAG TPA: hypothetical protein VII33_08680, partial [Nakamurella sp.]
MSGPSRQPVSLLCVNILDYPPTLCTSGSRCLQRTRASLQNCDDITNTIVKAAVRRLNSPGS